MSKKNKGGKAAQPEWDLSHIEAELAALDAMKAEQERKKNKDDRTDDKDKDDKEKSHTESKINKKSNREVI